MSEHRKSFCRICLAHCGIVVELDDQRVLRVQGDSEHPVSGGYTCVKGRALPRFHDGENRLNFPEIGRLSTRRQATWNELLDDLARSLSAIRSESGPDAIAIFTGSGASFDSAALVVTKAFTRRLGTRSTYSPLTIDGPSKPLVGALIAGHPGIFGADADAERTTLTLLVGSNPVVSHGHTSTRSNPRAGLDTLADHGELWIIDPRATESTAFASRHLRPRPGTDYVWLAALVHETLNAIDRAELRCRARGVDELIRAVAPFTLERASEETGIPVSDLTELRDAVLTHGRFAGLTGTGVTMAKTGTLAQWLMLALLVITDSADQPGGTLFNPGFIRCLDREPWRAGEHQAAAGPASRPELPRQFGEIPAVALLDEIEAGNIRALLVLGASLATCMPDSSRMRAALERVEVLMVADVVKNETTERATHLIACADQLERPDISLVGDKYQARLSAQYTPAMVSPAYGRRSLGEVLSELGRRMELGADFDAGFDPRDALAQAMTASRSSFLDLESARFLEDSEPSVGWVRAAVSERGGWNLAPDAFVRHLAEAEGRGRGMMLAPRREKWHLNSQLAEELDPHPGAVVYLNPDDMEDLGISDGDPVVVSQGDRHVDARALGDDTLPRDVVSLPHGLGRANVNELTDARGGIDPLTGMPSFTALPVTVATAAT